MGKKPSLDKIAEYMDKRELDEQDLSKEDQDTLEYVEDKLSEFYSEHPDK